MMYSPGTINTRIRRRLPVCRDLGNKTKNKTLVCRSITLLENNTERQTVSSTRWEQEPRALPFKRSSTREQDRETNSPVDVLGTRTPSAALPTIESAGGSEIGPIPDLMRLGGAGGRRGP
jgi:hypothetical protein